MAFQKGHISTTLGQGTSRLQAKQTATDTDATPACHAPIENPLRIGQRPQTRDAFPVGSWKRRHERMRPNRQDQLVVRQRITPMKGNKTLGSPDLGDFGLPHQRDVLLSKPVLGLDRQLLLVEIARQVTGEVQPIVRQGRLFRHERDLYVGRGRSERFSGRQTGDTCPDHDDVAGRRRPRHD